MTTNANTFAPTHNVVFNQDAITPVPKGRAIAVVGAGAFGGWTALYLLRRGYSVTLIDTWGPGNSRSSSGDETRVIRSTYGNNEFYFDLNVRALTLWKEHESIFQRQLFYNTGVLWFCYQEENPLVDNSIKFAMKHTMEYEYLSASALQKRYSIVNTDDLHHAFYDPFGGYLKAREATAAVRDAFVKEGGTFLQAEVKPGKSTDNRMEHIMCSNGTTLRADAYIFACGAWLSSLFPQLRNTITCTKQEVYYVGVPALHAKAFDDFPVWIDLDNHNFYYGIAGNALRGFKIGVDKRGEPFDPTHDDRTLTSATYAEARSFLQHRFPLLKDVPLLEHRVCPYENSPDGNFIFTMLYDNVYALGGGSGHGFKHGPAWGELIANTLAR